MKYDLFLFDLDDTLLDFQASERLSFFLALQNLGLKSNLEELYLKYQIENRALWSLLELNLTTQEHLKVERFRKTFQAAGIELDPEMASNRYLETLPETVVLIDNAVQVCEWLTQFGEIGIITNGLEAVQLLRIKNSKLAPYISFVSVSETCGYAKPDVRFFEYTAKICKNLKKDSTLIIGDRLEADILGAINFGVDSCWFNPDKKQKTLDIGPSYEIDQLTLLKTILVT